MPARPSGASACTGCRRSGSAAPGSSTARRRSRRGRPRGGSARCRGRTGRSGRRCPPRGRRPWGRPSRRTLRRACATGRASPPSKRDQAGVILRHVPGILPGVALGVVAAVVRLRRVERRRGTAPSTCGRARSRSSGRTRCASSGARLSKRAATSCLPICLGHARDGPVVEGIFDGLGGRFRLEVDRHVAELHVVLQAAVGAVVRAGDHRAQRLARDRSRGCPSCRRRRSPARRGSRSCTRSPGPANCQTGRMP